MEPTFDQAQFDNTSYTEMVRKLAKAPAALHLERTHSKQHMLNQAQRLAATAERLQDCLNELLDHHTLHGSLDAIRSGQWLHWEHMIFALAGEAAGEIRDAIKRHVIYGKELEVEYKGEPSIATNIKEEAGDCTFYIEGARQFCTHADFAYFWETIPDAEWAQGKALELLKTCEEQLEMLLALVVPDYTVDQAMADNKLKLIGPNGRYRGVVYSDAAAIERADKK